MSYDPDERRETPLARKLAAGIRASGPISVQTYMRACLEDEEHGYYRTQAAIGREGDFVTSPEISQVFGELIGLWAALVWQQMGSPSSFNLVELGPGRGTLMADALRAGRRVPGFVDSARVVLVEPNPILATEQQSRLAASAAKAIWLANTSGLVPDATVLIANEVIDVLPVRQFVRTDRGWCELGVQLDQRGKLQFCQMAATLGVAPPLQVAMATPGDVAEVRDCTEIVEALARLAVGGPVAALYVDYGYEGPAVGDSLQAVRRHRYEHPLASPGEADLTAHVDFTAFALQARQRGLLGQMPVAQSEFLGALGVIERASRLMAANPGKAASIEAGVARLISPSGMGARFKAIALRSAGLSPLPGMPS